VKRPDESLIKILEQVFLYSFEVVKRYLLKWLAADSSRRIRLAIALELDLIVNPGLVI
jgi:hypothetical protein